MKKLILLILFLFALSSVSFATPLTDYSKGNAALDITYRSNPNYDVTGKVNGTDWNTGKIAFDGDSNLEWGFTYGVGNNWGLQYRQATPKGNLNLNKYLGNDEISPDALEYDHSTPNINLEAKTRVEEYNVLYKVNKTVSLFTGAVKASPSYKVSADAQYGGEPYSGDITLQGHDKNIWQFGAVATVPVATKLNAYGLASFGSNYRNWEAGLGYELSKSLEFNVNYRDMKIDNMNVVNISTPDGNHDITTDTQIKGWGFGVTYKF